MTKYSYNIEKFLNEDADSFYLLGVFMTDGCIRLRGKYNTTCTLEVGAKDKDWLDLIKQEICFDLPTPMYKNCYRMCIYNKEIYDWFVSWGCTPRKSISLEFPNVPEKYLPDFIRGCMDGDGSIFCKNHWRKDRECFEWIRIAGYCSSSPNFLDKFVSILKQKEVKHYICAAKPHPHLFRGQMVDIKNPHWKITINGSYARKLLAWAYYPGHHLSMPRKRKIAQQIIDWNPTR